MSLDLRRPDAAVPGSAPTAPFSAVETRPATVAERPVGLSIVHILLVLVGIWCAAICIGMPIVLATTALAAVYGLLFLSLLPFNRWACFLVVVAACASEDVLRAWSPTRYNTVHYATFLLLPVAFILVRPRAQMPKPLIFWFGLCLWFAVTVFWSQATRPWLDWMTEYVGVGCLALLTRQLATSPWRRRQMGLVFAVGSLAVVVAMLVVFGVGSGERLGHMQGMALDPNGVGRLAAMGMLMLAMSATEAGRQRLLHPASVALYLALGVALLLTQSRGSMLAAAGAACTLALAQPRLQNRVIGLTLGAALGATVIFAVLQLDPAGIQGRWQSTFENRNLSSATSGRSEIARTAAFMLRDHWVAGVGVGQFRLTYKEYTAVSKTHHGRDTQQSAHSVYLKVPAEGGVVAILLLTGFCLSLWSGTCRLPPGQRRAVARAMVVYLLISWFSDEGVAKENWLAVGLLLVWFWENRYLQRRSHAHGSSQASVLGEARRWN